MQNHLPLAGLAFSQEPESPPGTGFYPIPPAYFPALELPPLTHPVLILRTASPATRPTWDLACYFWYVQDRGDLQVASDRQFLPLNFFAQRFITPDWAFTYRLYFEFPTWVQTLSIDVFAEL